MRSERGAISIGLIVVLLNSVAVLAALGTLVYTKMMFKRPAITESGERAKIKELKAKPEPDAEKVMVHFKPITVNISSIPYKPKPADGTQRQIKGKFHYTTLAFSFEIKNADLIDRVEDVRPLFLDSLIQHMGKKSFSELATVHGRYLLRNEILEIANELLREQIVSNVFFTKFIVQ